MDLFHLSAVSTLKIAVTQNRCRFFNRVSSVFFEQRIIITTPRQANFAHPSTNSCSTAFCLTSVRASVAITKVPATAKQAKSA